jgi:hypothetical protein
MLLEIRYVYKGIRNIAAATKRFFCRLILIVWGATSTDNEPAIPASPSGNTGNTL